MKKLISCLIFSFYLVGFFSLLGSTLLIQASNELSETKSFCYTIIALVSCLILTKVIELSVQILKSK